MTIVQFDEPFATGSNRCSAYLFPPAVERTHRVELRRIIELRDNKTLSAAQAREMSPAAEVPGYKENLNSPLTTPSRNPETASNAASIS